MDKNYIIKKSNYFIMNSSYDLSLEEQKLILTLASMVQPDDEDFKPYKFRINDFMELLGVDTKTKYTEIPKITKELMKKVFEIEEDDIIIQVAWLSSATYKKGTGTVELEFSPKLKPYMLKLNGLFTQYKLANILSMRSKYSPRIYEILKCNEFKKQGYIELKIEDLRKLLKSGNIYPRYNDFKRKVIIQTQKELKKISDISFEFEEIKTGRKVTSLKFYIQSNNKPKIKKNIIAPVPDEMACDIVVDVEEVNQTSYIEQILALINQPITEFQAKQIYAAANGDMNKIREKYDLSKSFNVTNLVGWLIKAIKDDYSKPINQAKKSVFNNYEQRKYDFNELERKLLGWDVDE